MFIHSHLSNYIPCLRSLCCSYTSSMISFKAQLRLQSSRKPSPPFPPPGNWTQGLVFARLTWNFLNCCSSQHCPFWRSRHYEDNCWDTTTTGTNHILLDQGQNKRKARLWPLHRRYFICLSRETWRDFILPLFLRGKWPQRYYVSDVYVLSKTSKILPPHETVSLIPRCSTHGR